ncbi:MAG TPA: OmpA family protein [Methylomirabilota bacterium]|nr:OmpA family protein [Methylomirabilota bacterium]
MTLGSLAIVVAIAGCSGTSWQFWKKSASTEESRAVATTTPDATAPPADVPVISHTPAATPAPAAEKTAVPAVPSNGYVELPGLADVRFRSGQVAVVKADFKTLDGVVRWLKENPGSVVMIEGHSDDLGSREENLTVGEKRAAAVMRYLISRGLQPGRISAISYGSERPVCAEKTDACRAKNRRARFLVKQ